MLVVKLDKVIALNAALHELHNQMSIIKMAIAIETIQIYKQKHNECLKLKTTVDFVIADISIVSA